jgi:DNA modification methylase
VRPSLPLTTILRGDALSRLAELPASSVDCVITSPPYFGLRDYGHWQQLGAGPDVDSWVDQLRAVCCELARVLKPSGSLWLNLADTYSSHPREGAPVKSLLCGPQRLALGLVEDGWRLRNQVVWVKRNSIPCSATDRLRYRHEVLLFLVRSPRYFFDLDAIRVPMQTPARRPTQRPGLSDGGKNQAGAAYPPREALSARFVGPANLGLRRMRADGRAGHVLGKNPGDVWELPASQFAGAHFATFPPELVVPPLLATCPERVCAACGQPWVRVPANGRIRPAVLGGLRRDCTCGVDWQPGVVLDPFMGSGTVALVAEQHSRDWAGIELNPVYAVLAEERIEEWRASNRDGQAARQSAEKSR